MCYMLIGGKNAFKDGVMLGGHNDDLFGYDAALMEIWPHIKHGDSDTIVLPTGPAIPQPAETDRCVMLRTFRGTFAGDTIAINEHNVCLMGGNNLAIDRNDRAAAADPIVENGCAGGNRLAALMQSKTARECVEKIGSFYTTFGNRFPCCVGVFDTEEAWYIEGGGGTTWLAVRVPDDCYLIQSNGYRINEVDLDDEINVIHSPGLKEFLIEKGLWSPDDGPFNWARTFGRKFLENPETYYYNSRRVWSGIRFLSPSQVFDDKLEEFPTFMKPDEPITTEKVMQLLRYYNEDNELSAFPEEGGMGDVRPICVPNCIHSAVSELHRDKDVAYGGVLWSCVSSPIAAPFIPHFFGVSSIIPELTEGTDQYSDTSAFWQMRKLTNLVMNHFQKYHPVVAETWAEYEKNTMAMKEIVAKEAEACFEEAPDKAEALMTAFCASMGHEALRIARELEGTLHFNIASTLYKNFARGKLEW